MLDQFMRTGEQATPFWRVLYLIFWIFFCSLCFYNLSNNFFLNMLLLLYWMDERKTELTHCIYKYRCFCFVIVTWGNEGYHRSDKIARRLSRLASFKSEGESREKCWWKVTFPDNILKAIGDCFSIYWMKWIYCQALFIFTKKMSQKGNLFKFHLYIETIRW